LLTGYGRREVVEFLLAAGASIQARDDGGLHPLHNACSFGHADVVRLLLHAGACPNTRDNWNYTPLHEAAIKGKVDVCIGKDFDNFKFKTLHTNFDDSYFCAWIFAFEWREIKTVKVSF
jgi:Ankyrin repeats (many copies)